MEEIPRYINEFGHEGPHISMNLAARGPSKREGGQELGGPIPDEARMLAGAIILQYLTMSNRSFTEYRRWRVVSGMHAACDV